MVNKSIYKALRICALVFPLILSTSLKAQETWHPIHLFAKNKPMAKLKAIGIRAKAECNGQSYDAFVVFWGREGSKIYSINMVIRGFGGVIPNSVLDNYRGPDLSEVANEDCITINIRRNQWYKSFSTRLVISTTLMLPNYIRGDSDELFSTNPRLDKIEMKGWNDLLDFLTQGMSKGSIVIGEGRFPQKIVVSFGGNGVVPLAKELMHFIAEG